MGTAPKNLIEITDDFHPDVLDYVILKKKLSRSVASHRHSFLEISFITGGSGGESVNGERHALSPGAFTMLLPYHVHEIYSSPDDPLELYNIAVSFERIFRLPDDFGLKELILLPGKNPPPFFQLPAPVLEPVEAAMAEMLTEFNRKLPWADLVFRAKLAEILVCFNRLRLEKPRETSDPESDLLFWKLVQYIHQHHSDAISLSLLQNRYGIRAHTISRLFLNKTGVNFHDFLNEIRIEHACSLLASSDLTVTDVAMEAGFNSYVTFAKTFGRFKGQTALQYKNSLAKASGHG